MALGVAESKKGTDASDYPSSGPCYSNAVVERELNLLQERSLVTTMQEVLQRKFTGVGSGIGHYGPAPESLLPMTEVEGEGAYKLPHHQDALMALLQPSIEAKVTKLKASEMRPIVANMAIQLPKLKENAVQRQINIIY